MHAYGENRCCIITEAKVFDRFYDFAFLQQVAIAVYTYRSRGHSVTVKGLLVMHIAGLLVGPIKNFIAQC